MPPRTHRSTLRRPLDRSCDRPSGGPDLLYPVAVAQVEFHRLVVRPFEPVYTEVAAAELLADTAQFVTRQHHDRRVAQEDQRSARAEQASGLGDPPVGIAPDAGSVLG